MGIATALKELRKEDTAGDLRFDRIPVDQIQPNPNQPRTHIDQTSEEFANLVGSIRERDLIQVSRGSRWQA
jgi:hypothetical protein